MRRWDVTRPRVFVFDELMRENELPLDLDLARDGGQGGPNKRRGKLS